MRDRPRGNGWWFRGPELVGLVLIAIGAIYLLGNAGIIRVSWSLIWPVIVIGIGALIILSAIAPRGRSAGSATVPRDGVAALDVDLALGAGAFSLSGGAGQLIEVRSNRDDIVVRQDRAGPTASVRLRQDAPWIPIGAGGFSDWQIRIADDIPTQLALQGGAGTFKLDLSSLRLVRARLSIGAAQARLVLPRPTGDIPISLESGAASTVIAVPPGVEARVAGTGGLLRIDGRTETPGYGTATDRVTVAVSGGAASITVV